MITKNQRKILKLLDEKGGEFTKADAVALLGNNYYCSADKHVGDILSRMVNGGILERVKNGVFKKATKGAAGGGEELLNNQINLF